MRIGQWVKGIAKPLDPQVASEDHPERAEPSAVAVETAVPTRPPEPGFDGDEPLPRWRAFIDRVTINAIEGWAMDTHNPGTHVTVEAVTSKGKTVVAVAHLFRQDVEDAGYGDGHCGFFLDLSKLSIEGESAIVRFAGSRHPITAEAIEFDPSRAVFTTEMPNSYKVVMERLAAETLHAAEVAGVAP